MYTFKTEIVYNSNDLFSGVQLTGVRCTSTTGPTPGPWTRTTSGVDVVYHAPIVAMDMGC